MIEDKEQNPVYKKLTKIDEVESFPIPKNMSSGYYKIRAYSSGVYGERQFYVDENEEAQFELLNDTLIITNIGNVAYKKPVQIIIGGVVEIKELNLEVGKQVKYRLAAPEGTYDIKVSDGSNVFTETKVTLTGNSIRVLDAGGRIGIWSRYFLVWFFLVGVLGLFIFVGYKRVRKKKFYAYPSIAKKSGGVMKIIPEKSFIYTRIFFR